MPRSLNTPRQQTTACARSRCGVGAPCRRLRGFLVGDACDPQVAGTRTATAEIRSPRARRGQTPWFTQAASGVRGWAHEELAVISVWPPRVRSQIFMHVGSVETCRFELQASLMSLMSQKEKAGVWRHWRCTRVALVVCVRVRARARAEDLFGCATEYCDLTASDLLKSCA